MSRHSLQGLIKWSTRDPWSDRFAEVLEDHMLPTCEETGLTVDDIVSTVGEDFFTSTVWACAFEDFLTREFDDGGNIVDDYLKRRGWKESASIRNYLAALRNSTMSLYEVSDIVSGTSFRARDLVRGGEPVLISEKTATRSFKPWDRIAARVIQVGSQTQISGAVLPYQQETSEAFIEALRSFGKLSNKGKRELAVSIWQDIDEAALADLSPTEMLRMISSMFTTSWLVDLIDRAGQVPDLRNVEGDELLLCELRYPFAAGVTGDDIRGALEARHEFRRASETLWNWISLGKLVAASVAQQQPPGSLTFETRLDDGVLVLGGVELEDRALVLTVNSRRRSDLGQTLLSAIFGGRVGQPLIKTETVEQVIASRQDDMAQPLDISEQERCAIVHDQLDRHYRNALDQPVPMLGGKSPRAAVKTARGRVKVADWIKMIENRTAQSGDEDSAMASYSFRWLWTELGIDELRR
jgi:hypothetical protein